MKLDQSTTVRQSVTVQILTDVEIREIGSVTDEPQVTSSHLESTSAKPGHFSDWLQLAHRSVNATLLIGILCLEGGREPHTLAIQARHTSNDGIRACCSLSVGASLQFLICCARKKTIRWDPIRHFSTVRPPFEVSSPKLPTNTLRRYTGNHDLSSTLQLLLTLSADGPGSSPPRLLRPRSSWQGSSKDIPRIATLDPACSPTRLLSTPSPPL